MFLGALFKCNWKGVLRLKRQQTREIFELLTSHTLLKIDSLLSFKFWRLGVRSVMNFCVILCAVVMRLNSSLGSQNLAMRLFSARGPAMPNSTFSTTVRKITQNLITGLIPNLQNPRSKKFFDLKDENSSKTIFITKFITNSDNKITINFSFQSLFCQSKIPKKSSDKTSNKKTVQK